MQIYHIILKKLIQQNCEEIVKTILFFKKLKNFQKSSTKKKLSHTLEKSTYNKIRKLSKIGQSAEK